jgi:comEA protein
MNIWQQLSDVAQKNLTTIVIVLIVAGSSFLIGSQVSHLPTDSTDVGSVSTSTPLDKSGSVINDIQQSLSSPTTQPSTPASAKSSTSTSSNKSTTTSKASTNTGIININTATQAELESLTGIGPTKAKAIIDYRSQNGPFVTVDDLDKVKGIGPATLAKIRDRITV